MAILTTVVGGVSTNLPTPSAYDVGYYEVDASTTGRNAAGLMVRDVVRHNVRKVSCTWNYISQQGIQTIMNATEADSFKLYFADPMTGAPSSMTCYRGDRSAKVYWMPDENDKSTWLFESFSVNFIEI